MSTDPSPLFAWEDLHRRPTGDGWMFMDASPMTEPWWPSTAGLEGEPDGVYAVRFSPKRLVPAVVRDGVPTIVRMCDLPPDVAVRWAEDPVPLYLATRSLAAWSADPVLGDDGVIRGEVEVHQLIPRDGTPWWRARWPLTVSAGGLLDVGGVLQGQFEQGRFTWLACTDPNVAGVGFWLQDELGLLRRMYDGGPGRTGADRVRALEPPTRYRYWAVDDVVAHADACVPALLAVLDGILADPTPPAKPTCSAPYAAALLASLRTPEAHERLLKLARLDEETFRHHLPDLAEDKLGLALARTAPSGADAIVPFFELIRDPEVSGEVRAQVALGLADLVALGKVDTILVGALLVRLLLTDPGPWEVASALIDALFMLRLPETERLLAHLVEAKVANPVLFTLDTLPEQMREPAVPDPLVCSDDPHHWLAYRML